MKMYIMETNWNEIQINQLLNNINYNICVPDKYNGYCKQYM